MSALPHSQLRVGVIGAGRTGRGIAAAFARAGARVAVFDPDPDPLSVVSLRVALELDALGADPAAARTVFPVDTVLAAAQADLVFEAAPEDLRTKRGLCATLGLLAPTAIVATVTERLTVEEIATATARPGRLLGTHWWDSVAGTGPVEVVSAPRTDPAVAERLEALLEGAGKSVVRLVGDRAHPPTGWATARSAERAP
jgi:3-hydroxyacyl-CoA dehydrogenase